MTNDRNVPFSASRYALISVYIGEAKSHNWIRSLQLSVLIF